MNKSAQRAFGPSFTGHEETVMHERETYRRSRVKQVLMLTLTITVLWLAWLVYQPEDRVSGAAPGVAAGGAAGPKDDAAARAAFLEAYKVLMHPRCMNCHPAGDVPLQGDDSRLHIQNIKRGHDGKGLYALKCANCH